MSRPPVPSRPVSMVLAALLAVALLSPVTPSAAERVAPQDAGGAGVAPPARPIPDLPENAEEIKATQGKPAAGTTVIRRPARVLTPMMAEIVAYLETHDQSMAAKRQQLASLRTDRAAALALQQEIGRLKMESEIEVLRIQARHALKDGRALDAQRIEASIEERLHPKVKIAPEARPVPQPASR